MGSYIINNLSKRGALMQNIIDQLPEIATRIQSIRDIILANIVLLGQIPAPTFGEKNRALAFLERLIEFQVDECSFDQYGNPLGIMKGTSTSKPPIFVNAHLDTVFNKDIVYNFMVKENFIQGPGLCDNSFGVGVLASIPAILKELNITLESDLVLAGTIHSLGKGNYQGTRHLLKTWPTPIRGAVCIESIELGLLNFFSNGMVRCDIKCSAIKEAPEKNRHNAILILNEVINNIMEICLPVRPSSKINIGTISGGEDYSISAVTARLGIELSSNSNKIVKSMLNNIKSIIEDIGHKYVVDIKLNIISNLKPCRLNYDHPLVKTSVSILNKLDLEPIIEPKESNISIFLANNIPAINVGLTYGKNCYQGNARLQIEPMYKGIAQLIGIIMAIDKGVCDEELVA